MISRRQFIDSGVAAAWGPLALSGCSPANGTPGYQELARQTWRHTAEPLSGNAAVQRELVRYATLAPSSHNTQCWKFRLEDGAISILPDLSRRTPAVDPDDHHLYTSLGCAAENLIQAALANGLKGEVRFGPTPTAGFKVALEPTQAINSLLFQAIPDRQCTRSAFDGKPITVAELALLEQAGIGRGVHILLLTGDAAMEKTLEYVVASNTVQMNDPAFIEELQAWIRFSRSEAVQLRDGLFSGTSGNPSLPRWLGSRMFGLLFTPKRENDKYAAQLRSSAGVAVFVSEKDDITHWVEAGRCYERFALQATALGIRNAMLNQPVEVSALRPQFAAFLGVAGSRPDLVVRFGRAPKMPQSLRRPVQAVLA